MSALLLSAFFETRNISGLHVFAECKPFPTMLKLLCSASTVSPALYSFHSFHGAQQEAGFPFASFTIALSPRTFETSHTISGGSLLALLISIFACRSSAFNCANVHFKGRYNSLSEHMGITELLSNMRLFTSIHYLFS